MRNATVTMSLDEFDAMREQIKSQERAIEKIEHEVLIAYGKTREELSAAYEQCTRLKSWDQFIPDKLKRMK